MALHGSTARRGSGAMFPLGMNLIVLTTTLTLGIAVCEVFLQRFHPVASAAFRLDDHLLHGLIPGSRRLFTPIPGNGSSVLVKVDDHGYRGDGFSEPRRGPRVVVYGDSFVEAAYTPLEETFVARLQSELRRELHQDALEAINAGVSAYGPDQSALRIEDEIAEIAPDLLVFCVFSGNDFGDLVRNRLFRFGPDGDLIEQHPVLAADVRKTFEDAQRTSRRPAVVRAVKSAWDAMNASALPAAFPNYIDDALALRRKEYVEFAERNSNTVDNLLWDGYDADVALDPESPSAQLKAELMARVLARIDRTTRAHHVPWLLVVIPDPVDVAGDDFELQVDETKYPSYRSWRLTSIVVDAARAQGIPFVNLYETLTEATGEPLFFRHGDNHWNSAGQAKAAAAVAGALAGQAVTVARPALSVSR